MHFRVILAITKDNRDARPTLFRAYDSSTAFQSSTVWRVARATSAAIGLFKPIRLGEEKVLGAEHPETLVGVRILANVLKKSRTVRGSRENMPTSAGGTREGLDSAMQPPSPPSAPWARFLKVKYDMKKQRQ